MRKVLKKWLIYVVVLCLVLPVGFVSQTSKVEAQPLFDDTIPGWVIFTTEQIDLNAFSFKQDDQEKYEGNYSLMLSLTMPSVSEGQYVSAETTFSVEPNTTYSLSMMVKGESVGRVYATDYGWSNGIQITKLPESTFDWQEFGYSFNSGDKTVWTLAILVVEPVGKLWIDNVKVTKQGSDENIVNNPGFEEKKQLSTAEQLDLIESNLPMLENLIVQVEAQGIPTDYERVNLQTIKDFIEYGREDLASNQLAWQLMWRGCCKSFTMKR